jgi:hypothetical protein
MKEIYESRDETSSSNLAEAKNKKKKMERQQENLIE